MAHLQGFGAQLGGFAAGKEEIVQRLALHHAPEERRLEPAERKLERVGDPRLGARRVVDDARLDRGLKPLRIAVRADRERRARKLK
jgi:hypothetical protein